MLSKTTPELIEMALTEKDAVFWLLAGIVGGRVSDQMRREACALRRAAHRWDDQEARTILQFMKDQFAHPSQ